MKFTWDEAKNRKNIQKHGLDFLDAKAVFDGPMLIEEDPCQTYNEKRMVGIGFLEGRVVLIVYSEPSSEIARIISMRKANDHEKNRFIQAIKN